MIGEALGRTPRVNHLPEQPGDVPATYADVTRARSELGYDPQVGMEEGLRRFVAWYHGE
jgi:UDP-glucuronate 4-epimerase